MQIIAFKSKATESRESDEKYLLRIEEEKKAAYGAYSFEGKFIASRGLARLHSAPCTVNSADAS